MLIGDVTLLCDCNGILIIDTVVNWQVLAQHFMKIPGMTLEHVAEMIDPTDHQNVPRAVTVIQTLVSLQSLNMSSYTPAEEKTHKALCLLGEVMHAFLEPFINSEFSLADQVRHLSRYAHLIFVLYCMHTTAFMMSQLYIDSQCVVKNVMFCIAKQQLLDLTQPFYLIQVGDNWLEVAFCDVRTQDHSCNFNALSLSRKLSTASTISAIMLQNPELDCGHRRIKVSSWEGPDHMNPHSVHDDVISGHVSLQLEWRRGHEEAEGILSKYNIPRTSYQFDDLFLRPDIDLLRPMGDGRYVGVSEKSSKDRSIPDMPISTSIGKIQDEDLNEDGLLEVELEDLLVTEQSSVSVTDTEGGDQSLDHNSRDWMEVNDNGCWEAYHLTSIVRCALSPKYGKKSVERVLHVYGVKCNQLRKADSEVISDQITNPKMFLTGDIGAALASCDGNITLVLVQVTALICKGKWVGEVLTDDLGTSNASDVTVTGQILHLSPVPLPETPIPATQKAQPEWLWTGDFLQTQLLSGMVTISSSDIPSVSHIGHFVATFPGWLFLLLNPDILRANPRDRLPPSHFQNNTTGIQRGKTWQLSRQSLDELVQDVWDNAQSSRDIADVIDLLPLVARGPRFPYADLSGKQWSHGMYCKLTNLIRHILLGKPCFNIKDIPSNIWLRKLDKDERVKCKICGKEFKLKTLRSHVGEHILLAKFNIADPSRRTNVHFQSSFFTAVAQVWLTLSKLDWCQSMRLLWTRWLHNQDDQARKEDWIEIWLSVPLRLQLRRSNQVKYQQSIYQCSCPMPTLQPFTSNRSSSNILEIQSRWAYWWYPPRCSDWWTQWYFTPRPCRQTHICQRGESHWGTGNDTEILAECYAGPELIRYWGQWGGW